jgi:hypothetical protein
MPDYYTCTQLCELFGVTTNAIRDWAARGLLPAPTKKGVARNAALRFPRAETDAAIAKLRKEYA